jgi:hypothetical protein
MSYNSFNVDNINSTFIYEVDNHNLDSFSVINNSISPTSLNSLNSFSTVSSTLEDHPTIVPHDNINYINGQHYVNSPNMAFDSSQPQMSQYEVFKFEIPGFEIIIRPKLNSVVPVNNLDAQSYSFSDSYSSVAVMPSQLNQNQSYISRNSGNASGSCASSENNINAQNIYNNDQTFVMDDSQSQIQQQQNSLGFNNFHV